MSPLNSSGLSKRVAHFRSPRDRSVSPTRFDQLGLSSDKSKSMERSVSGSKTRNGSTSPNPVPQHPQFSPGEIVIGNPTAPFSFIRRIFGKLMPAEEFALDPETQKRLTNLTYTRPLGNGNNFEVIELKNPNREVFATKYKKKSVQFDASKTLMRAVKVTKLLGPHPNIVNILALLQNPKVGMIVIMDIGEMNASEFARKASRIFRGLNSWRITQGFAKGTTSGLVHLGKHGIIHDDLRLVNILIDQEGNFKISDFDVARTEQESPIAEVYIEPLLSLKHNINELTVNKHDSNYGWKTDAGDIFSLGQSTMHFADDAKVYDLPAATRKVAHERRMNVTEYTSPEMLDFAYQFPADRPEQLPEKDTLEVFKQFEEFTEVTTQKKPADRPTAIDLLYRSGEKKDKPHPFLDVDMTEAKRLAREVLQKEI